MVTRTRHDGSGGPVAPILATARAFLARGWAPIPVPYRSKRPILKGWQNLRPADADLAQHFNGGLQNIGVLLGEPSGGLVDVDLDSPEALREI